MRYVATLFAPPGDLPAWSRVYTPAYADRFAESVRRHSPDADVVIITDFPPDQFTAGQTVVPFTLPHRGWAALMEMFRPELVGEDAAILCGLDTVFTGPLGDVEAAVRAHGYIAPVDPFHGPAMTNAIVGITWCHAAPIWHRWVEACRGGLPTDEQYRLFGAFSEMLWLRHNAPALAFFDNLQGDAVVSYKAAIAPGEPSADTRIVYFHGQPKPHDLAAQRVPWVLKNWGEPIAVPAAPAARGVLILSVMAGEQMVEDVNTNTLLVGPGGGIDGVRAWAMRLAQRGVLQAEVRVDGDVPREVLVRVRDVISVAMSDVVSGPDVEQAQHDNARANGRRIVANRRSDPGYATNMPPGEPGGTVLIVAGGPSADLRAVTDAIRGTGDRVTVYAVDRWGPRVRADAVVTLEPRAVKLDALAHLANDGLGFPPHAGTTIIAHVFAHPDRIPDGARVAWVQQFAAHYQDVPGWVPEIPPTRHVTAVAVWAAALTRPRRIVLYGCDNALAANGERYADGVKAVPGELEAGPEALVPALGGGTVRTLPNYQLSIFELTRAAEHLRRLGIECVNATAAGADIPGWDVMPLGEALAAPASPDAPVDASTNTDGEATPAFPPDPRLQYVAAGGH